MDQFRITDGWILWYKNASVPVSHREAIKKELKLLSETIQEAALFMLKIAMESERLSEVAIYMNENELQTNDYYLLLKLFWDSAERRENKDWDCQIYKKNYGLNHQNIPFRNDQLVGRIAKGWLPEIEFDSTSNVEVEPDKI